MRAQFALADDVHEAIKELLLDRRVEPGQRLNIDELARRLSVSPTPVREALVRLDAEGLVTKTPMKGYSVTPLLDSEGFGRLYEMRLLLEPYAARAAAERITRGELQELKAATAAMRQASSGPTYRQFSTFSSADARFHDVIAGAARNPFLQDALDRLRSHLQLSRLYFQHGIVDASDAIAEHGAMLAAFRDKNSDKAAVLMERHIRRSHDRLADLVQRGSSTPDDSSGDNVSRGQDQEEEDSHDRS